MKNLQINDEIEINDKVYILENRVGKVVELHNPKTKYVMCLFEDDQVLAILEKDIFKVNKKLYVP